LRVDGRDHRQPGLVFHLADASWLKFLHPFPLSEKHFLAAAKPTPQSLWGIYLIDVFDNMLLVKELPGYALLEPIPLRKAPRPPLFPEKVDLTRKDATDCSSPTRERQFASHWKSGVQ
jgi:hypothetical protein